MLKFATLTLLLSATGAHADCSLDSILNALEAPLDAMKPLERDVSNVESAEGGQWLIYREVDGRVNTIIRTDYGEMGRSDTRLSILNRQTYGISFTVTEYTRHVHLTEDGPFGVKSRKSEYYYYCDGRPVFGGEPAIEQQKAILLNNDVADFTKGLVR